MPSRPDATSGNAESAASQPIGDTFTEQITAMVADHAPRLFAIVIELSDQSDAAIAAWGIALDTCAYMITTTGNTQYVLTEPANALHYVRHTPDTTPHFVWVTPITNTSPDHAT